MLRSERRSNQITYNRISSWVRRWVLRDMSRRLEIRIEWAKRCIDVSRSNLNRLRLFVGFRFLEIALIRRFGMADCYQMAGIVHEDVMSVKDVLKRSIFRREQLV